MSIQFPELLAKWRNDRAPGAPSQWGWPRGRTLMEHTEECVHIALCLLDECAFGRRLYEVMAIEEFVTWEQFRQLCVLTVLLHDLGKAGSEFLQMLWTKEEVYLDGLREGVDARTLRGRLLDAFDKQAHRHEVLSHFLLHTKQISAWLQAEAGEGADIVRAAVLGHHAKTHKKINKPHAKIRIYMAAMAGAINDVIRRLRLNVSPFPSFSGAPKTVLVDKMVNRLADRRSEEDETRLSMAVKFVTILSDTFGSMGPKASFQGTLEEYREGLKGYLRDTQQVVPFPLPEKFLGNLFDIQRRALAVDGGDVLITSETGSGKFFAAYCAAANPAPDPITGKYMVPTRLAFTAPTTGIAAQFYTMSGTALDSLRTSRSVVDLDLFPQPAFADELTEIDLGDEDPLLPDELRSLKSPVTFTTPDQILGVVAYRRKSIVWLLYLVHATIVWDEFHAYDEQMLKWYRRFIRWFPGIRSISMSAVVSQSLEQIVTNDRPDTKILINRDDKKAHAPRYRFHFLEDPREAPEHFTAGMRTLWYVNTVMAAQEAGREFPDALVFHARYRYLDKVARQRDFLRVFGSGHPVRGVCTQIAQIAFDIEGGQGVIEACPPADFLQRIGRLTPRGRMPDAITDIYLYMPKASAPYEDLSGYESWYRSLGGRDWSQHDLVTDFRARFVGKQTEIPNWNMFDTVRRSVRNSDFPMATAVLEKDRPEMRALADRRHVQKFEVSVPWGKVQDLPRIYRYRYVIDWPYDPRLGVEVPRAEAYEPSWR